MKAYVYQGYLKVKEGKGADLLEILTRVSEQMKEVDGCMCYVVGTKEEMSDIVFVSEIWKTKEAHDDSLKIEWIRKEITLAMPLLDGAPEAGLSFDIVGGFIGK